MDVSLIIIYQFKKKGVELLLSYITCCLDDNDKRSLHYAELCQYAILGHYLIEFHYASSASIIPINAMINLHLALFLF